MIKAYAALAQGAPLQAFEYDPGPLAPGAVEIAVESCGLCHSDLSVRDNEWRNARYPLVPGHEVVGRVAARGANVTHLKEGDRVGLGWYSHSCMTCRPCMSGDHNHCAKSEATILGRFGGFADRVRASAVWAVPIPEGVDAASAGPLFCGGITVFNPIVEFGVSPLDRVGVVGIGGLGHMALMFLNKWGCEVTAFTSTGAKAQEAKGLGAHHVVNSRDSDAVKALRGAFDFILVTVNAPLDWDAYYAALAPKGRLHLVGVVTEPVPSAAFALIGGQKSLSGSPLGSPATTAAMLDFCARHRLAPITQHLPMSRINEAFTRLEAGEARYRLVLDADF